MELGLEAQIDTKSIEPPCALAQQDVRSSEAFAEWLLSQNRKNEEKNSGKKIRQWTFWDGTVRGY
jgi:hypothetical protein